MRNIAVLLTLLLAPYWLLGFANLSEIWRGRVGIALVFLVTGIVHFTRTAMLEQTMPAWVPVRTAIVHWSGVFELLAAALVLFPAYARPTGSTLCIFLLLVLPANIYAAVQRVGFSPGETGPDYLLIRVPLQFFLIGWIYWFTLRPETTAG